MESVTRKKEQETRILHMLPISSDAKKEPHPLDKDSCELMNSLEEVYEDLNDLDKIIDLSLNDGTHNAKENTAR